MFNCFMHLLLTFYLFLIDYDMSTHFKLQVSGRLAELRTAIDAGLLQKSKLLQTIGDQFVQWNTLVCS